MSESKARIIYALVAKGVMPLSGYSNFTGTFDQWCIGYLKNIGPNSSAAVKLENDYILYYINENNITYLLMTESLYPKEAALGCLESIKKEFQNTYPNGNFNSDEKFCLNNEFQTKIRMKFDYFNANTDVSNEALGQLKDEMNKMKEEVLNASGLLDERGEKLQVLDEKADGLSRASNNYYKNSKKVKRAELMKKLKLYGAIALVVIILIVILYFILS